MQSENKILDDLVKLASGAAGTLGDVKGEVEAHLRDYVDRILVRMEIVTREELEAVKEMAAAARKENEHLSDRLAVIEGALAGASRSAPKRYAGSKSTKSAKSPRATRAKKSPTSVRSSKSKRR